MGTPGPNGENHCIENVVGKDFYIFITVLTVSNLWIQFMHLELKNMHV